MTLPRLILTGASGFVGRHLLEAICDEFRVFGLARRSQARCGAIVHPNLSWHQVDIGDRASLEAVFAKIAEAGGAETVLHLAAHYDFTGDEHPEYYRTNVEGLRHTLDLSSEVGVKTFVFSSSVAACRLPPAGSALNEESPPDGDHVYARTKRIGETLVRDYASSFTPVVIRFAAMFSDWCEYPPLYMFLETWLSKAWNRRVLGGKGLSAIPYLHVGDAVSFLSRVLERRTSFRPGEILVASPDGCTNHVELFEAATRAYDRETGKPILMPKVLCGPGMWGRDLLGRLTGDRPFERPWMAEYIDLLMTIDASRTRKRLDWAPRERLEILRRMPFLIENKRTDPLEWHRLNRAAMKAVRVPENLRLHNLLVKHQEEIVTEYTQRLLAPEMQGELPDYQRVSVEEHDWNHRVILRNLMNAVRTQERGVLVGYCGDLARRRHRQGFTAVQLGAALETLNDVCLHVLRADPESKGLDAEMEDSITTPLRWGVDRIQETFEQLDASQARRERSRWTHGSEGTGP